MAYLANLLIPRSSLGEVGRRLSEMMEKEGYERLQRAVLFPHDDDEDVRFFLISKGADVMLLGSGFKGEMLHLQAKFKGESLLVWQEHGPWGVRGRSQEAELGWFENRKAGRFRNREPDGNMEWLAGMVKQFSSAEEWSKFCSCLRYGRWFTDRAVGEFCQGFGLPLAALSYDEMEKIWDGSLEARELEGWTIQLLVFKRRPEAGPKPMLESDAEEADEDYLTLQSLILVSLVLLFIYLFGIVMLLLVPLLIFGLMFAFITPVIRQIWVGQGQRVRYQFLKTVEDQFSNPIQLSEGKIYNTIHRCAATVPVGIEAQDDLISFKPRFPYKESLVFDFKLGDLSINATAYKLNAKCKFPRLYSGRKEERRIEFQAGPYPGTRLFYLTQTEKNVWHHYDWFIHTPQAVYKFSLHGHKEPVTEEVINKVDELVRSFEIRED
jgi:hypothetical protein